MTYAELLAQHNGDHEAAGAALMEQLSSATQTNSNLQTQVTELQSQVLPDGHVALPAADAENLAAYRQLGTSDQITNIISENGTLKRSALLRDVAGVAKLNPDALIALDATHGNDLTWLTEEVNGKPAAFVQSGNEKLPVSDFLDKRWSMWKPSLVSNTPSGTQWGEQQIDTQDNNDPVADFISASNG